MFYIKTCGYSTVYILNNSKDIWHLKHKLSVVINISSMCNQYSSLLSRRSKRFICRNIFSIKMYVCALGYMHRWNWKYIEWLDFAWCHFLQFMPARWHFIHLALNRNYSLIYLLVWKFNAYRQIYMIYLFAYVLQTFFFKYHS